MVKSSEITSTSVEMGFKALSDPLRLQVLDLLREQELCVCDLCDRLEVRQSKLSFHLKALKEAGLLRSRQDGKWVYYSLNLPQFAVLEQYLSDFRRFSPMLPSRICPDDEPRC
ncbi:MAG: metalloregulator ArsR/SmtB family transcription factor [Synechococcales bacterium]|nr:metalloregulator ArsR/SmtB family transcription factor [Synechococcales bacterium]